MNRKTKYIVLAALILGSGTVAIYLKSKRQLNPQEQVVEALKIRHKESNRIIERGNKEDPQALHRSLLSVASEVDSDILPEIKELVTNKNSMVKAAAGYALSFQKDEDSKATVEKLSQDPDLLVRSYLIHAAKQKPETYREKVLKNILAFTDLSVSDRAEATAALYLSLQAKEEKEKVLETILKEANPKQGEVSDDWVMQLNEIQSEDHRIDLLDRQVLVHSKNPVIISISIRRLAKKADAEVLKNYSKWIHHEENLIKMAALESIHLACPAQRWAWLEEGYKADETKITAVYWILEAERMGGVKAKEFLEKTIAGHKNQNASLKKSELENVLYRINRDKKEEACKASGKSKT